MASETQIKKLANKFCRGLQLALTDEEMVEAVDRNTNESNPLVCHSHDFCDANQVMIDVLGEGFENTDEQNSLINAAWNLAKKNEFKPCN